MKKTDLHDVHLEHGARMVDFEGWRMPVQYGPILEEVTHVRRSSGLFDLSHMGRFRVTGPDAVALVDRVATNYCGRIPVGSIRYSLLCREDGYPIDDLLLYRGADEVFTVVNASNAERDLAWMRRHGADFQAEVHDETAELAMIALQGPRSAAILQGVTEDCELSELGYYKFTRGTVCGIPEVSISRTGYTGEDGFELYFPHAEAVRVWRSLLEAGGDELRPIGLGARDTLRLEAGMPLYGHEIDEEHHPLEAGLAFGVSFHADKGDYVGRAALERLRDTATRRLVGLTTPGPRVPRQGYRVLDGGEEVGIVCSGSVSPTVGTNVATAYVKLGHDEAGRELELDVRGRRQAAAVQELPFYSRTRK